MRRYTSLPRVLFGAGCFLLVCADNCALLPYWSPFLRSGEGFRRRLTEEMVFFPKIYVLQSVLLIIAAATQQGNAALECDEFAGYYFLADTSKCRVDDINTVFDGGKLDDCNGSGWVSFSFLLPYKYNIKYTFANMLYHCKPLKHYALTETDCTATAKEINNHQLYQGAPTISCVSVSITFF